MQTKLNLTKFSKANVTKRTTATKKGIFHFKSIAPGKYIIYSEGKIRTQLKRNDDAFGSDAGIWLAVIEIKRGDCFFIKFNENTAIDWSKIFKKAE